MEDISNILTTKTIEILVESGIKSVGQVLDRAYKTVLVTAKKNLSKTDYNDFSELFNLSVDQEKILTRIKQNVISSNAWAAEINFNTSIKSKKLRKIFIDMELYLSPIKHRFDINEKLDKVSSKKMFSNFSKSKIIFGGAGAGKTTLMKHLYLDFLNSRSKQFCFPLMIRFRDIDYNIFINNDNFGLYNIVSDLLGIDIAYPNGFHERFEEEYNLNIKDAVITFFNNVNVLLLADGFDEIPDSKIKNRIEKQFEELSQNVIGSKFVLTSRSNEFTLKINNIDTYEICPLNDHQIFLLIKKWLNSPIKATDLFEKIRKSPFYDTSLRPLTLSHLCAIYERKGSIPDKPIYVYDFVIKLLLEDWDQERKITRPSKYADFYIEKKKDFLAHMSFWLTYSLNKNVFNSDDIRKCYNNIYITHNLPKSQAKKVVIEIENHTGLIIQVGYDYYQFSHKSLQEYLAAKYLSNSKRSFDFHVMDRLPNELAICICLSSEPSYYFEIFLKNLNKFDDRFWDVFLTRLLEEKPDFDNSHFNLLFFLLLVKKNKRHPVKNVFYKLLEITNLAKTFGEFQKYYHKASTYNDQVEFIYRDKHLAALERPGQPYKFTIETETLDRIISL